MRARECASHDAHLVKNTEKKKKSTPIMYRNASQKFQQHLSKLPHAMLPRKLENTNKWQKPEFSLRKLAELRKKAIELNVPWPAKAHDKARKPEKFPALRPLKGHKRLREEHVKMREMKLKRAEERQEEVMREHKLRKQKRAKGVDFILDEIFLTKKEKTIKMRTIADSQVMKTNATTESSSSNASKKKKE